MIVPGANPSVSPVCTQYLGGKAECKSAPWLMELQLRIGGRKLPIPSHYWSGLSAVIYNQSLIPRA